MASTTINNNERSPLLTPGTTQDNNVVDHKQHVIGRRRRASEITRLIGYLQTEADTPVIITAILNFESDPGIEKLRNTILERLKQIPRFRSRLVLNRRHGGYFEEVEIDVGYHFEVFGFNERVSTERFSKLVESCQNWPFSFHRPLWKVIHVPTLENGKSAAIFCVSHALGDGVSLVDALMSIVDDPTEINKRNSIVNKRPKPPQLSFNEKCRGFFYGVYEGLTITTWKGDKLNPLRFKGLPGKEKVIAGSEETIDINQIKEICKKLGRDVSINDVLMATLTKMVASYFSTHTKIVDVKKLNNIHAQFPLNLRKKGQSARNEHGDPNNNFGYGFFRLPLEEHEKAEELIFKVKKQIDLIKVSPAPAIARSGLPFQMKTLPLNLIIGIMQTINNLGTFTISNVPGPQQQVSLADVPIERFEFYLFTLIQNYIGIFSYNGKISCTVNMDKQVGVDPKLLANLFVPCFREMFEEICGNSD